MWKLEHIGFILAQCSGICQDGLWKSMKNISNGGPVQNSKGHIANTSQKLCYWRQFS
jgi:hypothetical protein